MGWAIRVDDRLAGWLNGLPADIRARIMRIAGMMAAQGPQNVREPYVKAIAGHKKLFEIRAKGKDGIARVFYFTMTGQLIVLLHGFMKKSQKTPKKEIDTAVNRMNEFLSKEIDGGI